jgi:hypothetical protein
MRYITATIGAVFIFVAVVLISILVNWFLPPTMQRPIAISLGLISFWATPSILIGFPLAGTAAVHSFRSTLKRHQCKVEDSPENSQS